MRILDRLGFTLVRNKFENLSAIKTYSFLLESAAIPEDGVWIGGNGDGSYILPNESLTRCKKALSPGVGVVVDFEIELLKRGFEVYAADGNIETLPSIPEGFLNHFHFHNKNVSLENDENSTSFNSWVSSCVSKGENYILQIDIEGFEHLVIPQFVAEFHNLPKVLVLELHNFHFLFRNDYLGHIHRNTLNVILEKYQLYFHKVNALAGFIHSNSRKIPKAIELTFILGQ